MWEDEQGAGHANVCGGVAAGMYVCMCGMHVCVHACMCVCMCVHACVHVCTCVHACVWHCILFGILELLLGLWESTCMCVCAVHVHTVWDIVCAGVHVCGYTFMYTIDYI